MAPHLPLARASKRSVSGPSMVRLEGPTEGRTANSIRITVGGQIGTADVLVTYTCPSGAKASAQIRVTVLSKDVVVIAWVDAEPIKRSLSDLKPKEWSFLYWRLQIPLSCNLTLIEFLIRRGLMALGVPRPSFSEEERRYINAFLLANSGNDSPPERLADPEVFAAEGDYRLFHRLQVGGEPLQAVKSYAEVGNTPDPCIFTAPGKIGDLLSSPDKHPFNGKFFPPDPPQRGFQINQGRLGSVGQLVSELINDRTVPWVFSVICFDSAGSLVACESSAERFPCPGGSPRLHKIDHQIFPTYWVYENGDLVDRYPECSPESFIELDETAQRVPLELGGEWRGGEPFAAAQDAPAERFLREMLGGPPTFEELAERSRSALEINIPFPLAADGQGRYIPESLSPELSTWAAAHGMDAKTAARQALFDHPLPLLALAFLGDPRGKELFVQGVASNNPFMVHASAKGLAKLGDTSAVPAIVAKAETLPADAQIQLAVDLLLFDHPMAEAFAFKVLKDPALIERLRAAARAELGLPTGPVG